MVLISIKKFQIFYVCIMDVSKWILNFKKIKFKIFNAYMIDVLKLILNFRKKIKNIQYMYDGCFKIMLNLKKIKNIYLMYDVLKLILNFKKKI